MAYLVDGQSIIGGPTAVAPTDLASPDPKFFHYEEEITLSTSGLTTDSTNYLLPANSIVFPIQVIITETIDVITNWQIGVNGTAGKFSAVDTNLTAGTTKICAVHWATTAPWIASDTLVRVTCTGAGNPTQGKIKVLVTGIKFPALEA